MATSQIINVSVKEIRFKYRWYGSSFPGTSGARNSSAHYAGRIYPTVNGMAAENNVYTGFLYAGLMIMPEWTTKGD